MSTPSRRAAPSSATGGSRQDHGRLNAGKMEVGLLHCLNELAYKRRLSRMEALRWLIAREAKKDPELRPFVPAKYLEDESNS